MAEVRRKGITGSRVCLGAGTRWGESAPLDASLTELPDLPGSSEQKRKYGLEVTFLFAIDIPVMKLACLL